MKRSLAIRIVTRRLMARTAPRLWVALSVLSAGCLAWLTSFGLLGAGVSRMSVRYGIAAVAGYAGFLVVLRGIAGMLAGERDEGSADATEPDLLEVESASHRTACDPHPVDAPEPRDAPDLPGVPELLDGDEALLLLIGVACIGGAFLSVVYVTYTAPLLLGELVADLLIAGAVARRYRKLPPRRWERGALRLTYKPFLVLCVSLVVLGAVADFLFPEARSIGGVLRELFAG